MSDTYWLSKQDFQVLNNLLGKLGYGGYYDFLDSLKIIGSDIGINHFFEKGDLKTWNLEDIKTIPEMMLVLSVYTERIKLWKLKHPDWIKQVLENSK